MNDLYQTGKRMVLNLQKYLSLINIQLEYLKYSMKYGCQDILDCTK